MIEPLHPESPPRLLDLLADRALFGLSEPKRDELSLLLRDVPGGNDESLDHAAALLQLSSFRPHETALPERLLRSLREAGEDIVVGHAAPPVGRSPAAVADAQTVRPLHPARSAGWFVAAAALLLAVWGWWPTLSQRSVEELRTSLISEASDLSQAPWKGLSRFAGVPISGGTAWSNERQEGYLLFEGLPVNDPLTEQYQLWIIDGEQRHPIDGGVFDCLSADRTVIRVDPKIRVTRPTKFAVTVEKPGGVVVSEQGERLVLVTSLD